MATVSIKIPDEMKEQVEEMSRGGLYQNDSEYIRAAIREKLEKDNGLTPAEEEELFRRIKEVEKGEVETVPLDEIE
ncbi:MAG: ribbon-helix-helix domain-containing protein [Candidatus Nanohalobium sp.]